MADGITPLHCEPCWFCGGFCFQVYSVHIGPELSQAEYKVDNLAAIRALLRKLQQISLESKAAE